MPWVRGAIRYHELFGPPRFNKGMRGWRCGCMRATCGEAALKKRLQQAQSEGELAAGIQPADFARYMSSVMAGLGVQAANGATRAELRRVAEIALRCLETGLPVPA